MKIKPFFITLIMCLWVSQLFAQLIQGYVKSENGDNIFLANIAILNTNLGTVTDQSGKFELPLREGTYKVTISAIGYATKVQTISTDETGLVIFLKEEAQALNEVVVTAQKNEQTIIETPLAITSLSAKKIQDTRTWNLSGLTALVPNYLYQELGVGFQQIQSIRGVQVFSENLAVATYIDGVNQLDILANGFQLTDVERIEVLRGPQGTLFGRNALGGVVNIITKEPTNETKGFAEIGVGNLGLQRHSLSVKTPIIKEKLFLGVSGLYQSREGYWENDTTGTSSTDGSIVGETVGDEESLYGNLYLKWLPSTNFSAKLNIKAQRDWSNASGFFVSQPNETIAFENPDKIYLGRIGSHERNIVNTALSLKYYAPTFTFTSISALQTIGLAFEDISFSDGSIFHSFRDKTIGEKLPPQRVWSQEIRVNSIEGSKVQYTAGVYGFLQRSFEPSTNLVQELTPNTFGIFRNEGKNYGIAAFGQLTYSFTDKLAVTAGLRYDYENREAIFNGSEFNFETFEIIYDRRFDNGEVIINRQDITLDGNYSALSPKLVIVYTPSVFSNLYASYTRGFRAGGINAQRLPQGIEQTFDPEYSDNYELGYKLHSSDNKLSISTTAFLIQWQGLQFFNLVAPPFTFARENVGDARSWGIEIQSFFIPERNLLFDLSFGLNETEYENFILKRSDEERDISGNSLSNAPSSTFMLGVQYQIDIVNKLKATVRTEARQIGEFFTDIQNDLRQPTYTLINARLALNYDRYELTFWGQNLTDERYLAFGSADISFSRSVRTASPLTYGMSLSVGF
ncbi:MAG: TonB-dependent receptor [Bacteroidota bacterium]